MGDFVSFHDCEPLTLIRLYLRLHLDLATCTRPSSLADPLMSLPAPSSDRLINQPFYKRLTHVRHFPGWITLPMCSLSIGG